MQVKTKSFIVTVIYIMFIISTHTQISGINGYHVSKVQWSKIIKLVKCYKVKHLRGLYNKRILFVTFVVKGHGIKANYSHNIPVVSTHPPRNLNN